MDFLRTLVSQRKNRYEENGFNLDLTYITSRTIAMAFPADGLESLYRNRIDDVAKLLSKNHSEKFLIINASNRTYDYSKFNNKVVTMSWPNHFPCPLEHFLDVICESLEFLAQDPQNTLIVHCLAGKGRTGSFLNALHFATGHFPTIEDANTFYFSKRAVNVTISSQLRYLNYFVDFYQNGIVNFDFNNKSIEKVQFRSKNKQFIAYLDHTVQFFDFSRDNFLLAEGFVGPPFEVINDKNDPDKNIYTVETLLTPWRDSSSSDILVKLSVNGLMASKLFRMNFSMLAIKKSEVTFTYFDLDKIKGLPKDFEMVFYVNNYGSNKIGQAKMEVFQKLEERYKRMKGKIEEANLKETLFKEGKKKDL